MEGNLRSLSAAELDRARGDADFLDAFLRREIPRELVMKKLASGKPLPMEVRAHYEALLSGAPDGVELEPALDLHKAWHGIHFLLTGQAWGGEPPLAHAVLPAHGQTIGDERGPNAPGYLTPDQVRAVSSALGRLDRAELERRYDPERMIALEIHPSAIWLREREDSFDWLMQFFEPLPGYYAEAAKRDRAMLVWIA
jgi:hypothetical protein